MSASDGGNDAGGMSPSSSSRRAASLAAFDSAAFLFCVASARVVEWARGAAPTLGGAMSTCLESAAAALARGQLPSLSILLAPFICWFRALAAKYRAVALAFSRYSAQIWLALSLSRCGNTLE